MGDFNPLKFDGRIGRLQYFGFGVIWTIIVFVLFLVLGGGAGAGDVASAGSAFGSLGLSVATFVATLSYGVRRLRDFDKSGWWYLLAFVPFVNFVFALILLFAPGTPGANRYGVRTGALV